MDFLAPILILILIIILFYYYVVKAFFLKMGIIEPEEDTKKEDKKIKDIISPKLDIKGKVQNVAGSVAPVLKKAQESLNEIKISEKVQNVAGSVTPVLKKAQESLSNIKEITPAAGKAPKNKKPKEEQKEKEEVKKPKDDSKKIFIYGMPQSGKTTLLASLIKYIDLNGDTVLRTDIEDNEYLKSLIKSFYYNKFPPRNSEGECRKLKLKYEEKESSKKRSFLFCEAGGAEIERINPNSLEHETLLPEIKEFFNSSDALIITAPVTASGAEEAEKTRDFIEYLIKNGYSKPILFIFTKIDALKENKTDIETVIKQYNGSKKLLDKHINSVTYGYFSVGETGITTKTNNKFLKRKESISTITADKSKEYAKEIIKFLESL